MLLSIATLLSQRHIYVCFNKKKRKICQRWWHSEVHIFLPKIEYLSLKSKGFGVKVGKKTHT